MRLNSEFRHIAISLRIIFIECYVIILHVCKCPDNESFVHPRFEHPAVFARALVISWLATLCPVVVVLAIGLRPARPWPARSIRLIRSAFATTGFFGLANSTLIWANGWTTSAAASSFTTSPVHRFNWGWPRQRAFSSPTVR